MKNLAKLLSVLSFAVVLSGCVSVPKTTLKYGKLKFSSPKDDQIGSLHVTVTTNGSLTIIANKISATNNPEVINSSAVGQVEIIKALADGFGAVAGAAAKAAAKP